MKTLTSIKLLVSLLVLLLTACPVFAEEVIDFEALPPGTIVTQVNAASGLGPIYVEGTNPDFAAGTDAALIFDSANPTGGDDDLGTKNETFGGPGIGPGGESGAPFQNDVELYHVLIVAENLVDSEPDGLVDDPDDAATIGSQLVFDFDEIGPVIIKGITLLDVEGQVIILNDQPVELPALISFYDASLTQIGSTVALSRTGSNGLAPEVFDPPIENVFFVVVELKGSGAIDNLLFVVHDGCTPGYWRQPHHLDSWVPTGYTPSDDFDTVFGTNYFVPDITLLEAIWARGGGYNKLARHGTAALLNASNPLVPYPLTVVEVIAAVQNGDSETLAMYNELREDEDVDCPAE